MTKLEQLEKAVVGTKDSFDTAYDAESAAWYAWDKARDELAKYLKEHGDEPVISVG